MPTHAVPEGGLPAWAEPDPSQPSTVTLAARVELDLQEWRGQWARVVADNGWSGWVDGTRLVAVGASDPPSSTDTVQQKFTPALLGAMLVAIGTVLPWVRLAGESANSFKVPLKFLADHTTSGDGFPHVGELVLLLGIVLGVAAVMPQWTKLARPVAAAVIVVTILYVIQLQRLVSAAGDGAPSVTSLLGFGLFVTLAGAIGTIAYPVLKDRR